MATRKQVGEFEWDKKILYRLMLFHPEPIPQVVFLGRVKGRNPWAVMGDHYQIAKTMGYSPSKKRLLEAELIVLVKQKNKMTGRDNQVHLKITSKGLKVQKGIKGKNPFDYNKKYQSVSQDMSGRAVDEGHYGTRYNQ